MENPTTPTKGKPGRPPRVSTAVNARVLQSLGVTEEQLADMSPQELLVLQQCIHEVANQGVSATAVSMLLTDYRWEPVSMAQFLNDPYYMGKYVNAIYPVWRGKLIEMFDSGERPPSEIIFSGSIGVGKCLSEHELCTTGNGLLKMSEVYESAPKEVQTRYGVKNIAKLHDEGETETRVITTNRGHRIEGRPNHRLLVLDTNTFATKWKYLQDLKKKDVLLQAPAQVFGQRKVDRALAELVGWAVAEGYWPGGHCVHLSVHRDEVRYLVNLISCVPGILLKKVRYEERSNAATLLLKLSPELKEYFPPARSGTQQIPRPIREGGRKVWLAFLRGYFSGDGTVDAGRPTATTVSVALARQLRTMLTSLGYYAGSTNAVAGYTGDDGVRVPCQRRNVVSIVGVASRKKFIKEIGFTQKAKRDLLADVCESRNGDHAFAFYLNHRELGKLQPKLRPGQAAAMGLSKAQTPSGLMGRLRTQRCTITHLQSILEAGGHLPDTLKDLAEGRLLFDTVDTVTPSLAHCYDLSVHDEPSYVAGGFISHNTTIAGVIMTYLAYQMTCLRDIHDFYKLNKGSNIYQAVYSLNLDQALDGIYGKILSYVDTMPYFEQKCPRIKRINSVIKFSGVPLQIIPASKSEHVIGKDVRDFAVDEINFMAGADNANDEENTAYKLYTTALSRMQSRFTMNGRVVGTAVLASSRASKNSFLDRHIKRQAPEIKKGNTAVLAYAHWEVRPATDYKLPKFAVEVGDRIYPSRMLRDGEEPRKGSKVLYIPGEYRARFVEDLDAAIRNLAGESTESMLPLFHDKTVLRACAVAKHSHPFTRECITIDLNVGAKIDEYFLPEKMFRTTRSAYQMRLNPGCPRYAHIDIGYKKDALGMTLLHLAGFRAIKRIRRDGTSYEDRVPVIVVDFHLKVIPPAGSETDISCARSFLTSLRDYGVPIVKISYDSHQSVSEVQTLKKLGFDAVVISVDRNDEPYLALKQLYMERRISNYLYEPLIEDLECLERNIDKRKVDHPKGGGKDTSDSLAGAAWTAINDKRAQILAMVPREAQEGVQDEVVSQSQPTDSLATKIAVPGGNVLWTELDREVKKK